MGSLRGRGGCAAVLREDKRVFIVCPCIRSPSLHHIHQRRQRWEGTCSHSEATYQRWQQRWQQRRQQRREPCSAEMLASFRGSMLGFIAHSLSAPAPSSRVLQPLSTNPLSRLVLNRTHHGNSQHRWPRATGRKRFHFSFFIFHFSFEIV